MNDIFALWSPWAVVAAIASGITMARVVIHLRPDADTRLTSYLVFVLGVMWYLPLIVQRAVDGAALDGSHTRTVGTFLLYMTCFATPLAVTLAVHRHRRSS